MTLFKTSKLSMAGFAFPAMPLAAFLQFLYFFLTSLYAVKMGLGTVTVGAVFFTAKMFDVVTDPLFGALSDKYPTSWGRRPWSGLEPSTRATSETIPFVANCLPTHRQLVPPWLAYKLIYR